MDQSVEGASLGLLARKRFGPTGGRQRAYAVRLRPVIAILLPDAASANTAPRAAPPLPTTRTDALLKRRCRSSGAVTPGASVLVPRHFPALRHTVFTAPIRRATGST